MKEVNPPEQFEKVYPQSVFLAGSIENGTAEEWQKRVLKMLEDTNFIIYNPRRPDWDSTWEQKFENDKFYEQVEWELDYIRKADYVLFYFDPNTKAPITLMELGYVMGIKPKRIIVVCPDGFWKRGNIDVACYKFGVIQRDTLEGAIEWLKKQ